MPILAAAKKALRQSHKKFIRKQQFRNEVSFLTRMVRKSLDKNNLEEAKTFAKQAAKQIDKGITKGIFKKNTASRKKSVIVRQINNASKK